MISKLLWVLHRGLQALRTHTKFLFIIALLFIFPFAYLQLQGKITHTALQNIKTTDKASINILHHGIFLLLEDGISSNFFNDLTRLSDELPTTREISILTNTEGNFILATTTNNRSSALEQDFILQTAPQGSQVFIFADESPQHRWWTAISKHQIGDTEYIVYTTHDYTAIDQLIKDRQGSIYVGLAIGFLFLLLVAYWLLRQTNWEAEYLNLQQRLREQEMLITTITHEFRAPLTAIKGYASFLGESNRLRPRDKESLSSIQLSTERMVNLVNDFLEVAKIQSGKLPFVITNVSVSEIVAKVILGLRETASEKRLYIRDGSNDTKLTFPTDAERLEQILVNLVNNAIKYSMHGGITITYEKTPLHVRIRVQDTGSGISADDQKRLFMPFSRVGGVEKTAIVGSGLGMWITKRLVENLGGSIGVESISGVGTHIVVTFDLRKIAGILAEREGDLTKEDN